MRIALDFDGTIVEHKYPEIGEERPMAVSTIKKLMEEGHEFILWSVREGELLDAAVKWCEDRGIRFYAVNANHEGEKPGDEGYTRKVLCDMVIDDRNFGGLPSWGVIYQVIHKRMTLADYIHREERARFEALQPEKPKKKHWWS